MTRGRLAIHGHFYQPAREDPFAGGVPAQAGAAPYHDWNERVTAECYAPNAELGNFARIGWDLGPALAAWLREHRPAVYAAIVEQARRAPHGGMAVAYHHAILPLASARDRRTEIRWGLRDFELRFGRRPAGLWLPETAVDLLTLRTCAEEGVHYTVLAPWQAADPGIDPGRIYRVEVGGGRHLLVVFYDAALSAMVSFEPAATSDASRFALDRVAPRVEQPLADGAPRAALIATDGELYGHHQPFRDHFLAHLVDPGAEDRGFDVATLGEIVADSHPRRLPIMSIRERTSWSCHHGVARWSAECPDATDGRWKGPLRAALDRLAAAIDVVAEREAATRGVELWPVRDAWVDVASGFVEPGVILERMTPSRAAARAVEPLLRAQASRLAMFASDAWFWEDPGRPETAQALRFAGHAARLTDRATGTRLEAILLEDLAAFRVPGEARDGASLYRAALAGVRQPTTTAS